MTNFSGGDYKNPENWQDKDYSGKLQGYLERNPDITPNLDAYYKSKAKQKSYAMPVAPENQKQFPQKSYGLPPEWDYKTAKIGPNGEKLPVGAVGWTPQGRAYYGTKNMFTEWVSGVMNNTFSKSHEAYRSWHQENVNALTSLFTEGGFANFREHREEALSWKMEYRDYKTEMKEKGERVRAFGGQGVGKTISGGLGQGLEGLGAVLEPAERLGERVGAALTGIQEVAEMSELGEAPSMSDIGEGSREEILEKFPRFLQKPMKVIEGIATNFDPVDVVWDSIRASTILFGNDERKKETGWRTLKERQQSSRILYSTWVNEAVQDEFVRRYNQGENPYLLADELGDPWAELLGGLILDPLNFIGGAWAKGSKTAKQVKVAGKARFTIIGDDLLDAVKALGKFDNVEDWNPIARVIGKKIDLIKNNLSDLSHRQNLISLATTGKRSHMADIVGGFFGWMSGTVTKEMGYKGAEAITEMQEIMRATLLLSSEDAAEVGHAIKVLGGYADKGLPLEVFLSDGGLQTSYILREFMSDGKDIDKITKLLKKADVHDIEGFFDVYNKRVDKAIANLFPTLKQRLEAGEELTSFGHAMLRVEDFANSRMMRGVNSFFAHVYMGMSPGYAARNVITNTIHVLMDEGLAAFKGNPFSIKHLENDIIDLMGYMPKTAQRAMGAAGEKAAKGLARPFGLFLELGTEGERRASVRVYAAAAKRVFKHMLQEGRAIPSTAGLIEAGMEPKVATHLVRTLMNANGDVRKAEKLFRSEMATGSIDLFRSMGWMDDVATEMLERYSVRERFRNLIHKYSDDVDSSMDELLGEVEELFDSLDEIAEGVSKEATSVPTHSPALESVEDLRKILSEGSLPEHVADDIIASYQGSIAANKWIEDKFQSFSVELQKFANDMGLNVSDLVGKDSNIYMALGDQFFEAARKTNEKERTQFWRWTNQLRSGTWDNDLAKFWKRNGLPGKPPENLDRRQVLDFLWEGWYRPQSRYYWAQVRETYTARILDFAEIVFENAQGKDAFVTDIGQKQFQGLQESLAKLVDDLEWTRKWDRGYVVNGVNMELTPQMVNDFEDLKRLASLNGIHVGPGRSQLLNILKKKRFGGLENLTDVASGKVRRGRYSFEAVYATGLQKELSLLSRAGKGKKLETSQKLQKILGLNEDELYHLAKLVADDVAAQVRDTPLDLAKEMVKPLELKLNVDLPELKGNNIFDYSYEQAVRVMKEYVGKDFNDFDRMSEAATSLADRTTKDIVKEAAGAVRLATPENPDLPPTLARGFHNGKDELAWLRNRLDDLIRKNWGAGDMATIDPALEGHLSQYFAETKRNVSQLRYTADKVATGARDFALLNYGEKNNLQMILALTHPYSFWYTGTYPNWMKRLAQNPKIIAGYMKYRRTLEDLHAGQPDWWKYNVNTNELFGLNSENPMFFNLEATMNPMYGLTGVDFDDPYKNVDATSHFLNDMNRYGPSAHTLFSIANALRLYRNGEKDAAARWAGRLFPQTQTIRAGASLLGMSMKEIDPMVMLFNGDTDPYTERRVARALSQMQLEGMITEEQAIDAARSKSGMYWNLALERAITARAPGQLSSFLFGVGFKARSVADMSTDMMYRDYFNILQMRDNLSPAEFRQQMDMLHEQYPQMNTVLISDTSEYAYNVLGRIPPGASTEFYDAVGLNRQIINMFYENKGDMSFMSEGDRLRFESAIVDLGAILAIPADATRREWTAAKNEYTLITDNIEKVYGEEIVDMIDTYYGLYRVDKDLAKDFLRANPDVESAMDMKAGYIAGRPESLIATYYGGIEQIENYYKGQMYDEAERIWGEEIFAIQSGYYSRVGDDRKQFLKDYPQLKEYWEFVKGERVKINNHVIELGSKLQEGLPAEFREDVSGVGVGASEAMQQLLNNNQDPYMNYTPETWISYIGEQAFGIALDKIRNQRAISYREQKILDQVTEQLPFDENRLLQYIGISVQKMSTLPVQNP